MNLRIGNVLLRVALALLIIGVMGPFGVSAVGKGDWPHVALAAVEVIGALLLVVPRTVLVGSATLLGCIVFVLAVQHGAHGSVVPLLYLALLLFGLILLDRALRPAAA